jgi:general secretion pathway protein G
MSEKSTRSIHRGGFTLMEIMISVLILGVLLGIAVPGYSYVRTESRIKEAKAQVEIISTAITRLAWDTGRWPGGIPRKDPLTTSYGEVWDLSAANSGLRTASSIFPGWKGPYLPRIPLDPWGQPYFFDNDYRISNVNYMVIGSFGPNRAGQNLYDEDDICIVLDKTP